MSNTEGKPQEIALDIDDVVADMNQMKREWLSRYNNETFPEAICSANIDQMPITIDMYRLSMQMLFKDVAFAREHLQPMIGSIESITELRNRGFYIKFVTARTDEALEVAKLWLGWQGIDVDKEGFTLVGTGYGETKAEFVRGVRFFVEDDVNQLVASMSTLLLACPPLYLMTSAENRSVHLPYWITRVDSWEHLMDEMFREG